jgi:hypothetical protein
MKPNAESVEAKEKPGEIRSLSVLGARVTWFFLGPAALMLILVGIVSRGDGWLTALDAAFGVVVGLMILGRWVEQRSGAAMTVTGQPATVAQYRRYITRLPPAAVAVWVVANVLGNHILT